MGRVSAVEDDLELAERRPEPSPEPRPSAPMLPPFRRPHRPAAPPPPPPSTSPTAASAARGAPRRSLGLLPRRSLLVPEDVRPSDSGERGSDEGTSDEEPESEKPRRHRPRRKRRSRILSELRPVDGPESALPSVPAINDDDSQASDDPLEAPDSGERAKEAFAAQRVRMRKSWCPDLRIYMKNAHPLFGICAAHRHHPYKRGDRFLVLLVAMFVALLLCGLFAIRDCCSEVLDVPVAVVTRRLGSAYNTRPSVLLEDAYRRVHLRGGRRMAADVVAEEEVRCLAFYEDCSAASTVCAEGSTCRSLETDQAGKMQCVPDATPPQTCVAGECPTGWQCSGNKTCIAPTNYLCYLPAQATQEERTAVNLAASSDDSYTAIEAIFQILQIGAEKHAAEMQMHNSSSSSSTSTTQDENDQQAQSPTSSPSTTSAPDSSSASRSASAASSSSDSSRSSPSSRPADSGSNSTDSSTSSAASSTSSESASGSLSAETSTVQVTLTEPVNGGVYSLSSTILIEWELTLLSGPDPGLDTFQVDFSADGGAFDTIATNVSASSSSASSGSSNSSIFTVDWDLADNTSWLCTTCVLRICALDVSSSSESLCIRSDGQAASSGSSRRLQSTTTVEGSGSSDVITFRIVREAFECSCGIGHASFLLAAVVLGVCIPVVVLLAEPLVTFYRDRQVFGLFTRRDGPARPMIATYSAKPATRKGRVLLLVVLLALCVACGFVAAQITTTRFLTEKAAIVVLWVVTFAIAVALGALVYCTLVCFLVFSVRWRRERAQARREPSGLSEFRNSLLSDDGSEGNERVTSPGWTVRGSEEWLGGRLS